MHRRQQGTPKKEGHKRNIICDGRHFNILARLVKLEEMLQPFSRYLQINVKVPQKAQDFQDIFQ